MQCSKSHTNSSTRTVLVARPTGFSNNIVAYALLLFSSTSSKEQCGTAEEGGRACREEVISYNKNLIQYSTLSIKAP